MAGCKYHLGVYSSISYIWILIDTNMCFVYLYRNQNLSKTPISSGIFWRLPYQMSMKMRTGVVDCAICMRARGCLLSYEGRKGWNQYHILYHFLCNICHKWYHYTFKYKCQHESIHIWNKMINLQAAG